MQDTKSMVRDQPDFLLSILESTFAGIVTCDLNGVINYANQKAIEIRGTTYGINNKAGTWYAEHPLLYIDRDEPLKFEDLPLIRALKEETVRGMETRVCRPDGQILVVSMSGNPLYDEQKKLIGAMVSIVDITESKKKSQDLLSQNQRLQESVIERTSILQDMNIALGRSQTRFRTIVEQSPFGIQIFNNKGKTLLINPAWKQIFNLPEEFIQNFIMKEYNVLEDPLLEKNNIAHLVKRAFEGEIMKLPPIFYNPRENGHGFDGKWIESMMYPLKQSDGSVREIVLIHNDVTELHISREQRSRFIATQNFLAHVTDMLLANLDLEHVIEQITVASIPFFCDGAIVDLLEGDKIKRIITKHKDPEIEVLMNEIQKSYNPTLDSPQPSSRVMRTGRPELLADVDLEVIKLHTRNAAHADLIVRIGMKSHIAIPLLHQGKVIGALNFLITTDRKHFDEHDLAISVELARRSAIAINNARLYSEAQMAIQQRDDFISIASHELKTPITSLKLQHEVIMKAIQDAHLQSEDSKYANRAAANANRQLDRLTRLVEDMLDISRISTGKLAMNLQNTDFTLLTEEVLERFSHQLKTLGIEIRIEKTDSAIIHCDPYRMEQVLTNLMTNAIRYGERRPILITMSCADGFAYFKVKDRGIGIAKQDQERIFNRFERGLSFNDISGLGLGLYISKQIVSDHNGELSVESIPGLGSTFTIKLKTI